MLEHDNGDIVVRGAAYALRLSGDAAVLSRAPYADYTDGDGSRWSRLSLLGSVSTMEGVDETLAITAVSATEGVDEVLITIEARSSRWTSRITELRCDPLAVSIRQRVTGSGRLDDVILLGGQGSLPGGAGGTFRSSIDFASLLVPVPTEPVAFVRSAASAAAIGVVGDADPGRLHGIYSPPPLVLGLGRLAPSGATVPPEGEWLALHVREAVERLTFTQLRYEPLDGGFVLRLAYEGHTAVDGEWVSPEIVIAVSDSGWGVIDVHRNDLVAHGFASPVEEPGATWWQQPLFCGWGAQCARSAVSGTPAPELASAGLYDDLLGQLDAAGVDPGTVVIDDRWQSEYGTGTVNTERWPDLKGWIAGQHALGRKVLLWWKAWDPEGLPIEECVTDIDGVAVSADAANPAYLKHLRDIVTELISPDGLDADGFKVDFTQRAPSGRSLRAHDGAWGIAGLHALLATMHEAAHAAKPDALVVTHAVHPSFASVSDMSRLNDVLERDMHGNTVPVVDQLRARVEIVSRSQPHRLIDTDQWPMPNRAEWLAYAAEQALLGVPALYYVESIDNSGERIEASDLAAIADSWKGYRDRHGL